MTGGGDCGVTTDDDLLEVVKGVCGNAFEIDAGAWETMRDEGAREGTVGDFGGT